MYLAYLKFHRLPRILGFGRVREEGISFFHFFVVSISKFVLCSCAEARMVFRCQGFTGRLSKGIVAAMVRSLECKSELLKHWD